VDVLVVWAHPRPESFSRAVLDTTVAALRGAGHAVDVIDLYGEGVAAAMSEAEWLAYRELRPATEFLDPRHVELVRRAEHLVFVYPTWWFGLPAVLKGWMERTLVPGVVFHLDDGGRVRGDLDRLRRVTGVATYGSAPWYVHLVGDAGRRTVTRSVRGASPTAWAVRTRWLALYRLDTTEEAEREAFLRRIENELGRPGGDGRRWTLARRIPRRRRRREN
jgi:NAD(P)H dehydrogenase (quinone)